MVRKTVPDAWVTMPSEAVMRTRFGSGHPYDFGFVPAMVRLVGAHERIAPFFGAFTARAAEGRYPVANVLMIWAAAGVVAMGGRALVFDRELFTAFFAIGITGAGLFLAGWRATYNWWATRSSGVGEAIG